MQHTLWPGAGHRCNTTACAGQQNLWGTVTTSCCGPWDPVQGEGQRIVAAKPVEAAPGSQHRWGPNPKTATGSPRAAWAMSPVHWEHLMGHPWKGQNLPLPLGQRTHLMASNSTVVRRGWGMDEKPALPPQRQEGRQWERMLPHHQQAPCLVDDRLPASFQRLPETPSSRTGTVPSATICIWLSHRAVRQSMSGGYPNYLQQVLQKQPLRGLCCAQPCTNLQQANSADMAPRCKTAHSKQIQWMWRERGEEDKQEGRSNTSMFCVTSFQHPPGPKMYPGFPLWITSANNQCLLSAAWSTNPSVRLPNSMQNNAR